MTKILKTKKRLNFVENEISVFLLVPAFKVFLSYQCVPSHVVTFTTVALLSGCALITLDFSNLVKDMLSKGLFILFFSYFLCNPWLSFFFENWCLYLNSPFMFLAWSNPTPELKSRATRSTIPYRMKNEAVWKNIYCIKSDTRVTKSCEVFQIRKQVFVWNYALSSSICIGWFF